MCKLLLCDISITLATIIEFKCFDCLDDNTVLLKKREQEKNTSIFEGSKTH